MELPDQISADLVPINIKQTNHPDQNQPICGHLYPCALCWSAFVSIHSLVNHLLLTHAVNERRRHGSWCRLCGDKSLNSCGLDPNSSVPDQNQQGSYPAYPPNPRGYFVYTSNNFSNTEVLLNANEDFAPLNFTNQLTVPLDANEDFASLNFANQPTVPLNANSNLIYATPYVVPDSLVPYPMNQAFYNLPWLPPNIYFEPDINTIDSGCSTESSDQLL